MNNLTETTKLKTEAIVITPVKDSLETVKLTIDAVSQAKGNFEYIIYNDYSKKETKSYLEENQPILGYQLVHLEDVTTNPSPNYKTVLKLARNRAMEASIPLIIIESDVIIQKDTIEELLKLSRRLTKPGLIGSITTDVNGHYNFPYGSEKKLNKGIAETRRSLSFCCTLLTSEFMKGYDFSELSQKKDWFDIYISRQSRKSGFKNYLIRRLPVVHLPHSSRPWKQLKYTHPVRYYFYKLIKKRDRI